MPDEHWERIQSLYHQALKLSSEERRAFLANACAGDNVVEREIEALLSAAEHDSGFVEELVGDAALQLVAVPQRPPFMIGTRLAHYEITAHLGSGGMGDVYRAADTKLNRKVAIKVLPTIFAHDTARMARFEREARVLAALNHPNLAVIHDLAEAGGSKYLILELVEGESLQERLRRGAIPVREALGFARQIADGLQAAHEKGIVHRDLKPGNIQITPDGRVKVLDFGLAKVSDISTAPQSLSNSPTISDPGTGQGVILGTAPYMSPEQARGRTVNKQSDVWSFGCVLYEMLTGGQAFPTGETVTDTLARILVGEPDWTALPPDTPAGIRRLLRRCLQKDTKARLRSIGDARIEIDEAFEKREPVSGGWNATNAPRRRELYLGILAAALCLSTVVLTFVSMTRSRTSAPASTQPSSLTASLAGLFTARADNGPTVRFGAATPSNMLSGFYLSPDGLRIAFVAEQKIWTRRLDSATPEAIPNARVANFRHLFWSADSKEIGFLADGKLQKVQAAGGNVDVLGDAPASTGAWNNNGVILIGGDNEHGGPILRIAAAGGQAEPATELDASRQEQTHRYPFFLPDGRHFFFLATGKGGNAASIAYVGELGSKERHPLPGIASEVKYLSGHALFIRAGKLMAQRFDTDHLKLDGEAFSVDDTFVRPGAVTGQYSVSSTGILAYAPTDTVGIANDVPSLLTNGVTATASGGAERQLTWFDRKGRRLGVSGLPGIYARPEVSPDGKYIAFERGTASNLWILNVEKGFATQLTTDPGTDALPRWSPDGTTIMFTSDRDGTPALYQKTVGATAPETKIPQPDDPKLLADWSADGKYAVYSYSNQFFALPLTSNAKPVQLTEPPFGGPPARVSPDGKWLALSAPGGIWIQSFPQGGFRQQIWRGGGIPRWSRDSREVYFLGALDGVQSVISVTVNPTRGGSVELGQPTVVFALPSGVSINQVTGIGGVTADGRFLLPIPVSGESTRGLTPEQLAAIGTTRAGITVIVNWRGKK